MEPSTELIECDCDSAPERDFPRSSYWRYTCSWKAPPVDKPDARGVYALIENAASIRPKSTDIPRTRGEVGVPYLNLT